MESELQVYSPISRTESQNVMKGHYRLLIALTTANREKKEKDEEEEEEDKEEEE